MSFLILPISERATRILDGSQKDQDRSYTPSNGEQITDYEKKLVRWVAIGNHLNSSAEGAVSALIVSQVLKHPNVKLDNLTHDLWETQNNYDLESNIQDCNDEKPHAPHPFTVEVNSTENWEHCKGKNGCCV
jgi:hypothetical protein